MAATIRIAILAQAAKAKAEMRSVADRARDMGARVRDSVKGFAQVGAKVASFASLIGPATSGVLGLAHGLSVAAANAAAMAPALALAPSVLGGWQFLKFTISGIGEQMAETLKPLGDAFKAAQAEAGKLASRQLPALSSAFQKVNLPNISAAMNRIGKATGDSVGIFGRWVNSTPGIKLIKDTTDGVASAFERAAPSITAAVISLGNMANRANVAERLAKLGDVVARLADKFNAWTDSVTSADVDNALTKAGNAAQFLTDKLKAIRDVIGWMSENQGKVKAISDAIAGLGIVLGIATGNPVAVAIGAFTLLTNHWDQTKAAFSGASSWWSGVWAGLKASPELQQFGATVMQSATQIWTALKSAFSQIAAVVMPPLRELGDTIRSQVVPALSGFLSAMTPIYTFLIAKLAPVVGTVFASIINVIRGALTIISGIIKVVTGVIRGDWSTAWAGIKSIVSGAWTVIKAVISAGWAVIKGVFSLIGPTLRGIASSAWGLVKSAFSSGIESVVSLARGLGSKVRAGVGNLGGMLLNAGRELIQGLINGIGDRIEGAVQKVRDGVARIKGLLPGSPVKWGPLVSWNNGGAGKRLMGLLADGIRSGAPVVSSALSDSIRASVHVDASSIDLSRATTAQAPILLRFEATGDPLMDAIFEALRKRVRVSGGNVQAVLGR